MAADRHATAVSGPRAVRLRLDPAKLVVMLMGRALARREIVVALPEEIDICNAARVAKELTSAVSPGSVVIIDMSASTFCDCAGAHAIVRTHRRATDNGAVLRLVVAGAQVRRILGLLGIDRLLEFYPCVEAARGEMPGGL
jgi:anti-anti-sigma factor